MALIGTLQQGILKHILGLAAWTEPTGLTLALFTTAPSVPGGTGGVEVSGGSYARQAISFAVTGTGPAQAANGALISFPVATANWGTIVAMGVYDNNGNLVDVGTLTASKTINNGDQFTVPASDYTIDLT